MKIGSFEKTKVKRGREGMDNKKKEEEQMKKESRRGGKQVGKITMKLKEQKRKDENER